MHWFFLKCHFLSTAATLNSNFYDTLYGNITWTSPISVIRLPWNIPLLINWLELLLIQIYERGFRLKFGTCHAPNHNTLVLWVAKWRTEGSIKDTKPPGRPHSARTPANVERVRKAVHRSSRWSTWQHAVTLHLHNYLLRMAMEILAVNCYSLLILEEIRPNDAIRTNSASDCRLFTVQFLKIVENPASVILLVDISTEMEFQRSFVPLCHFPLRSSVVFLVENLYRKVSEAEFLVKTCIIIADGILLTQKRCGD
ncbi:hypothetical protein ANN_17416, partial [Periplaneta americana]